MLHQAKQAKHTLMVINEAEVVQTIKAKEVTTGKLGHYFITRTKGVLRKVSLSVDNGILIANGREVLDLNAVEFVSLN